MTCSIAYARRASISFEHPTPQSIQLGYCLADVWQSSFHPPQPTGSGEPIQHAQHHMQRLHQVNAMGAGLEAEVVALDEAGQHLRYDDNKHVRHGSTSKMDCSNLCISQRRCNNRVQDISVLQPPSEMCGAAPAPAPLIISCRRRQVRAVRCLRPTPPVHPSSAASLPAQPAHPYRHPLFVGSRPPLWSSFARVLTPTPMPSPAAGQTP